MERKTSLFSFFAFANASGPQGYQSTGLCACWSRYGLVSRASRFVFFGLGSFGGDLSAASPAGRVRQRASGAARPATPRATMVRLTGSSLWRTWRAGDVSPRYFDTPGVTQDPRYFTG